MAFDTSPKPRVTATWSAVDLVPIGQSRDVPPGSLLGTRWGSRPLGVANVNGRYIAFPDMCLHYQIPLSQGRLAGDVLTCRWHQWEYKLLTGELCSEESIYCSFMTFHVIDVNGHLLMDPRPATKATLCESRYDVNTDCDEEARSP